MTATAPSPAQTPPLTHAVSWASPTRAVAFSQWLQAQQGPQQLNVSTLRLASADASFRRYLRVDGLAGSGFDSRIIMDAPSELENCAPFVQVAQLMQAAGLSVPQVLAWDQPQGFMLLSDLGAQTLMQVMNREDPQANQTHYLQAVDALIAWQKASQPGVLPPYDAALLRRELELFPDWYLARHRGVAVEGEIRRTLDAAFTLIIEQNLSWPSVYVHRDFMPRNLMLGGTPLTPTLPPQGRGWGSAVLRPLPLGEGRGEGSASHRALGVLDFQDAVYGPITYDIASLMRDAFLTWDEDFVLDITVRYWQQARAAGLPVGDDFGAFYRGVEWMGLQRHLKVAGIFARLTLRDGKPQYLADTPRFIHYIRSTTDRYHELKPLMRLIDKIEGTHAVTGFAYGRM